MRHHTSRWTIMQKPLLYISYGMAKSGSTLGYQLVRTVLEQAGIAQPYIDMPEVIRDAGLNFVEVIRPRELTALRDYAEEAGGTPIAIKTHSGMWNCVENGLNEGWIIGHAVARDPRDIALSMMDASRDNRAWGKRDGEPLRHIEDALEGVRNNAQKFLKWADHPSMLTLNYARLAFDTEASAKRLADQLGVEVDIVRAAKAAKKSSTNFNKGARRRHTREMSEAVSERIGAEFRNFIDTYCDDGFEPKRPLLKRLLSRS
ncbi:MAG: sulfotransferase domain-containing protein [Pseudomonadota bacterium]